MNKWLSVLLIFLFSLSLRVWNLNQMGRTWDETEYVEPGYKLIELLKKGDFGNSYFYTTYNHPPLVKYLYGLTAHLDLEKKTNDTPFFRYDLTYSRILSALIFSLGVVIVFIIGWETFSPVVGMISGIILSMLPFSLGISQLVTAESFKIFIYPFAVYSYMHLLKNYSIKKLILSGIITGIALQVKQSNILLLLLLGLMYLLCYKQYGKKITKKIFGKWLVSFLWITLISVIVFILIWPQFIFNLQEIYKIHNSMWNVHFSSKIWQITLSPPEVFFGRLMLTPIFYYPVYFFISIPILILLIFFVGLNKIFGSKKWPLYSLVLWFVLPFILSFYSWRQHGLRYIIEIYPAISIISAIGFDSIVSKLTKVKKLKLFYFLPVVIYLFVVLWNIKPYYLDYFNELVGGVNTVFKYNLFQIGWWGQGEREAGLYLKRNAPKDSRIGLAISPEHTFPKFDGLKYFTWSPQGKYDYVVVNHYHVIRDGFNDSMIRQKYKPSYLVKASDAILVTVYKAN